MGQNRFSNFTAGISKFLGQPIYQSKDLKIFNRFIEANTSEKFFSANANWLKIVGRKYKVHDIYSCMIHNNSHSPENSGRVN